jgi:hypothetical protein
MASDPWVKYLKWLSVWSEITSASLNDPKLIDKLTQKGIKKDIA